MVVLNDGGNIDFPAANDTESGQDHYQNEILSGGSDSWTLGAILQDRAPRDPDRLILCWCRGTDTSLEVQSHLTYAHLHARAQAVAACVRQRCSPGEHVAIVCPEGNDFVVAFFGCQLAGAVAVPVEPPVGEAALDLARRIFDDSRPSLVLASAEGIAALGRAGLRPGAGAPLVDIAALSEDEVGVGPVALVSAASPAWLQYYDCELAGFGRGVVTTHAAAVAQCRALARRLELGRDSIGASCLPLTRNMGLVSTVLLPVMLGGTAWMIGADAFAASPVRWLRLIAASRASHVTAPAFMYRLATMTVTDEVLASLDLSHLRVAVCGNGDAITPELAEGFLRRFAPCGLQRDVFLPAFVMREAVAMIAGRSVGEELTGVCLTPQHARFNRFGAPIRLSGEALSAALAESLPLVLSVGRPLPGHTLKIVDPKTCLELAEGAVGEIWIAGPSVATGYLNDKAGANSRFQGRLKGVPSGSLFLKTGYLGALLEGELFPLMSLDGAIAVRGVRHAPDAVEVAVEAAEPRCGRQRTVAFRVNQPYREGIILVHEREADTPCGLEELSERLRRAVMKAFKVTVEDVVLLPPGVLPRWPSGEPDRPRTRHLYFAGALRADLGTPDEPAAGVVQPVSRRDAGARPPLSRCDALDRASPEARRHLLQTVILSEVQAVLGLAQPPDPDIGVFELGLDSLRALELRNRLQKAVGGGIELPMTLVFEHPTVAALSAALDDSVMQGTAPIGRADRGSPLPLSYQQERLWFLDRLDPSAGAAYHIEGALRLTGPLDREALCEALRDVVARHESLRSRFTAGPDGVPAQVIDPSEHFEVVVEDVDGLDDNALSSLVRTLLAAPFDLSAGPLFRARLLNRSDDEHVLVVGGHHAVLDGWSVGVLLKEVSALYREAVTGVPTALPALPVHYADYAAWQRQVLSGEALAAETAWWREHLAGIAEAIVLPFDRPRPQVMDYSGGSVALHVPATVTSGLKRLAATEGATLFMALAAAFSALLSRLGAGEEVVIGTAVAGRPRLELEGLSGFFVNTVALRQRVDGLLSFREHLAATRQEVLQAFSHQGVPFEAVVEAVSPTRALGHPPLVQVMLVLQNTLEASASLALPGVTASSFERAGDTAQFELTLELRETAEGLVGQLSYAAQLFDPQTVERIGAMFARLSSAAVAAPDTLVADLALLAAAERAQVVTGFNATGRDWPCDKTVVDLFAAQAAARPAACAVIDGEREFSYGDLDAASSRLARHLIGLGVGPERVVGVCLERSAELIVSLLAIWKAGGAYLPLDPGYPQERLDFMLADSGAGIVVTATTVAVMQPQRAAASGASGGNAQDAGAGRLRRIVELDDAATEAAIAALSDSPLSDTERSVALTPASLAYVIYTSGSTGKPKGVMVGQGGLVNRLAWMQASSELGEDDVILQKTPATFDVSVWEFFWWAINGARVVMLAPGAHRDPAAVADAIALHGITTIHFVPSLFAAFLDRIQASDALARSPLKWVFTSGEALPARQVRAFHTAAGGRIALVNLYGPTEATVDVTAYRTGGDELAVPIGSPVSNTQVYVVDARLEPVPVGVAGELLIGGVQVARGYLGRSGLTAEKFVADPFSGVAGSRLYRTGDLGRWRADGTLEFLGRIDAQVKIRGMRVEPGEIEAALSGVDGIAQAVVVARKQADGDTRLVAYVVPSQVPAAALTAAEPDGARGDALTAPQPPGVTVLAAEGLVDLEAVRAALKRSLPEHMVPSGFVIVSRLPLTASGKVDRKALPEVDEAVARAAYEAPEGETERLVAAAFGELLGVAQVGRQDGFFELGGHSLLAVRLAARLEAATGKAFAIRTVFEAPTVAELAAALARVGGSSTPQADADLALALVDAACVESVPAPAAGVPATIDQARTILLTGATGFLGRYLLRDLLIKTDAQIICLVRSHNEDDARQRLEGALAGMIQGPLPSGALDRVRAVVGDLAAARLGLDNEAWHRLGSEVDVILHNGADVNFVKPYAALRGPNVDSVRSVLALMAVGRPKALHFVSTLSVFDGVESGVIDETTNLADRPPTGLGYALSKWVAERILSAAQDRGFKVKWHRPSLIVGDAETGFYDTNDTGTAFLDLVLDLGAMPHFADDVDFPWINVDRASAMILDAAADAASADRPSHIFEFERPMASDVVAAARAAGIALAEMDLATWMDAARRLIDANPDHLSAWLMAVLPAGPDESGDGRGATASTTETQHERDAPRKRSFIRRDAGGRSLGDRAAVHALVPPIRWFAARRATCQAAASRTSNQPYR